MAKNFAHRESANSKQTDVVLKAYQGIVQTKKNQFEQVTSLDVHFDCPSSKTPEDNGKAIADFFDQNSDAIAEIVKDCQ